MQRSLTAPLAELATEAERAHFTNPSVIVVGEVVDLHSELNWFEQKPLFGKTIVVTRAREQASSLVAQLTELGAHVLECPTIRIEPWPDTRALTHAITQLATYQWIVFTSANGVRFFWQALEHEHLDARACAHARVCAIGPATAQALASHGINADLVPARFVAESLVEAMLNASPPETRGKILIPRANEARDVLPNELAAAGFTPEVIPCYQTVPDTSGVDEVLAALREERISCITFASSQTVKNFLSCIPVEAVQKAKPLIAAIGPITAKTITQAGLTCDIEPEEYTIPALVRALTHHFS